MFPMRLRVSGAVFLAAALCASAGAGVDGVAITIHLEPQKKPAEYWSHLVAIVAQADTYGHRLNLLMADDWADYATASEERLATVARWVLSGHQVGYHHHDVTHKAWDGYCSVPIPDCKSAPAVEVAQRKLDALEQALRERYGIPAGTTTDVNLACQGPSREYRQYEWFPDHVFAQGGDEETPLRIPGGHGSLTTVGCTQYGGVSVAQIGGQQLAVGNFGGTGIAVADVLSDVALGGSGEYVSVVFHAHEYVDQDGDRDGRKDRQEIDELFAGLYAVAGPSRLMTDILSRENPCGR